MTIKEKQKEKSKYNSPKEYKFVMHKLLHTEGLKLEKPLRKIFEFLWNCPDGVTKAAEEKISEIMTKRMGKKAKNGKVRGYGVRTIKSGIKYAKEYGLLKMELADPDKNGNKTSDWKIVSEPEVIFAFIQSRVPSFALEFAPEFAREFAPDENSPNPCGSKDEVAQKTPNLNCSKQKKTKLSTNNTASMKEASYFPSKFEKIEVTEEMKNFLIEFMESKKYWTRKPEMREKVAKTVQATFDEVGADILNPNHQHDLKQKLGDFYNPYADDYGEAYDLNDEAHYYRALAKTIRDYFNKRMNAPIVEQSKEKATQPKKQKNKKQPTRTELLPDWFGEEDYSKLEKPNTKTPEEQKNDIEEMMKKLRNPKPEAEKEEDQVPPEADPLEKVDLGNIVPEEEKVKPETMAEARAFINSLAQERKAEKKRTTMPIGAVNHQTSAPPIEYAL